MTHTFVCHPFGDPFNTVCIKTSTMKKARELAAFRLKVQRHLVYVKPEQTRFHISSI